MKSTLLTPTKPGVRPPTVQSTRPTSPLQRLGLLTMSFLIVLVTAMAAVPILLLFVVTSVPTIISFLLGLAYVAVVSSLFRLERTLTTCIFGITGMVVLTLFAVGLSQGFAETPPITDAYGQPLPNSIASLESVTLGGSEQWITLRGHDVDKPVLLFLAGGPGGSELVMTRRYLHRLEEYFVVVNWDQPGTGKSYHAVDIAALTPDRFVSDAYELTLYLRERFDEEKIYLLGESWGSILGIWLVQQHPELYHAFVSTGQMVSTTQNDVMGYEFALEYLTQQGQHVQAEALRRNGPPPYTGDGMAMQYMAYLEVLNDYMHAHAHGEGVNHNLVIDSMCASEYGLLDKVNWVRGLSDVYSHIYPQLADLDLRTQAAQLAVPVYFIEGRWDVNAMTVLVEEYCGMLQAPHKELIWFENSGHTPLWDEPDHFVDVMVNTVLAQTLPSALPEQRAAEDTAE